jgi:hypothetical protein
MRFLDVDSLGKKLTMFQKNASKRPSFQGTKLLKA